MGIFCEHRDMCESRVTGHVCVNSNTGAVVMCGKHEKNACCYTGNHVE